MKELHARAQSAVTASPDESLQLLRAVEDYPRWYPDGVKSVSVLERDAGGATSKVRATLHVAAGPLVRDFNLTLVVTTPAPNQIKLTREAHGAGDHERFEVAWTVSPSQIAVALDANLSVPRLLPVGGVGESIANGFVNAAARTLSAH
ncbi:MAG: SRPBCC family protein [Solirubrobacteraceae bacterium]